LECGIAGKDLIGAREQGGEEDYNVEEEVKGRFGVELPGRTEPFGGGEEAGFAVEQRGADLLLLVTNLPASDDGQRE
jgi:hypothetical protein